MSWLTNACWQQFLRFKKTRFWRFSVSLKLAIFVMLSLAIGSAVGTFYESWYDTPTAQFFIYKSWWFMGVQGLLALNIFCVAMDRYPWKRRQIPFLMAHAGILMLIWGSVLTYIHGVDGNMLIEEGSDNAFVSFQDLQLTLWKDGKVHAVEIPWLPPDAPFKGKAVPEMDWVVDRYISRSEGITKFEAATADSPFVTAPAIHLRLTAGPPMNLKEDFWMWGRNRYSSRPLGPASIELLGSEEAEDMLIRTALGKPTRLEIWPRADGSVEWMGYSSKGTVKKARMPAAKIKGGFFQPGWMDLKVEVLEYFPQAHISHHYSRSRLQYGDGAGEPAIRLSSRQHPEQTLWLGKGDYVELKNVNAVLPGRPTYLGFMPKRTALPFQLRLDRFEIKYYAGTTNPKEYSSVVTVENRAGMKAPAATTPAAFRQRISMNQPLEHQEYIFYQSSYVPAFPRPTISIFSVNQDPGRYWKYWGSVLLVLGAIFLFVVRFYKIPWLNR